MTNKIYIYGLSSSFSKNNIRYVGYTNNPTKRKKDHIYESRAFKTHRHRWIQEVLNKGEELLITILRETTEDRKGEAETETILLLKSCGANLVNGNNGGLGGKSPSKEARLKMSLGKLGNTWNKGRKRSEANNMAILAAIKRPRTSEAKLNISKAKLGKRTKKRLIEDSSIIKMYELYNSGITFDEIVNILNIKRSTLSNVFYSNYYLDIKSKYNLKLERKPYNNQYDDNQDRQRGTNKDAAVS